MWSKRQLTSDEQALLQRLVAGATLKSHRFVDGAKVHRLHGLDGETLDVSPAVVDGLRKRGFIASNKKFPAATYLITEKGCRWLVKHAAPTATPLATRHYASSILD